MLLLLLACTDAPKDDSVPGTTTDTTGTTDTDSGTDTDTTDCSRPAPTEAIVSPAENEVAMVDTEVSLEARSTWNTTTATLSWSVDDVVVATESMDGLDTAGPPSVWVASGVGTHTVAATVVDDCGRAGTDTVELLVAEPTATWTVYGSDWGIPTAAWYGLSVGLDGTVWGATSVGLVRFRPDAAELWTLKEADGLTSDYPRAVLAASDGTVWIGHVGDTKRQGEQVLPNADGSVTVLRPIDYTESTEIVAVYRLREDPSNGDIWMGANEGINVWDADLQVFAEHAHPTHPHSNTYGVAFTDDGYQWNLDTYQVSRWNYSDDGDLSPSADLVDYWVPWPVKVETPVNLTDADGRGEEVWGVSSTYGVAHFTTPTDGSTPTTELRGTPFPTSAYAVRFDRGGRLWIGGGDGLYLWDGTAMKVYTDLPDPRVQQLAVDPTSGDVWVATSFGLVRITGTP